MFLHILLSTLLIFLSLSAAPSIEELKARVLLNPELLKSAQAQAKS